LYCTIGKLRKERIVIIDLRQEFHWLIHDRNQWVPFNLFEPNFPYNRIKNKETIVSEETDACKKIDKQPYIDILHIQKKGTAGQIKMSKKVRIYRTSRPFCLTEEQLIKRYFSKSCIYYRVPIQDHCIPDAQSFDMLKKIIANHQHDWIHLHCKGGVGRTSLVLMIIDILRHKKAFTFNEYVQRQIKRGGANLWKHKYRTRLEKIRKLTGF
jgi:hypothetical protein